jgi:hypothetical protein
MRPLAVSWLSWLLVACAGEPEAAHDAQAELTQDAASVEQPLDAQAQDAALGPEARVADATGELCEQGAGPALEFGNVCVDAARGVEDAGVDSAMRISDACVAGSCSGDAAVDAQVDAPGGPCASNEHDCATSAYFVAQPDTASCSFGLFDVLEVRYRDCETCGKAGYAFGADVVIMDCGGCAQVYAEGNLGSTGQLAAGSCRSSRITARLDGTEAKNCIDVYVRLNSSYDGMLSTGLHSRRMCRCDVAKKQCISCNGGACDAPMVNGNP